MEFDHREGFPEGLKSLSIKDIRRVFPRPALLDIPGATEETLFLSILLHGNETTSFDILKKLARYLEGVTPPKSLMIFVGNVWSAEKGVRYLPGQEDYNRIWSGGEAPECTMMQEVTALAKARQLFASLDIHNNTGNTPPYACFNRLEPDFIALARLFAPRLVYFHLQTIQSTAFAHFCPSTTLECGLSGSREGFERAFSCIWTLLHQENWKQEAKARHDITVYEIMGRIELAPQASMVFGDGEADLIFPAFMDRMNFSEVQANYLWAQVKNGSENPIRVMTEKGKDITPFFLKRLNGGYRTARTVIPAMLTQNQEAIRQDCLGYFMRSMKTDESLEFMETKP